MLRYAQADASLPRDCRDVPLWYRCQKEVQDSRNSSAFPSYSPKGAERLRLQQAVFRECATAGSCLALPRWRGQQEGQELVTGSQRCWGFFFQ